MSALKHMEVIFAAVLVVGVVVAALPDSAATPAPRATAGRAAMPVVVVKAKRMTALEKRQSAEAGSANGT